MPSMTTVLSLSNHNYPKIEYSEAGFVQDNGTILNWSGNHLFDMAGLKPYYLARPLAVLPMKVVDPPQLLWHSPVKLGNIKNIESIHQQNFDGRYFRLMQVMLTWHITNSANEWCILNGSLAGVFMILITGLTEPSIYNEYHRFRPRMGIDLAMYIRKIERFESRKSQKNWRFYQHRWLLILTVVIMTFRYPQKLAMDRIYLHIWFMTRLSKR